MIRDLRRIYYLVSDLIYLYHPITLEIRYKFHIVLNRVMLSNNTETSREEWESIVISVNNYTLASFVKAVLKSRRFRKNIINVLSFEREKLVKASFVDLEEQRIYWNDFREWWKKYRE